jgi:uncharacterized Zn-finger protein
VNRNEHPAAAAVPQRDFYSVSSRQLPLICKGQENAYNYF